MHARIGCVIVAFASLALAENRVPACLNELTEPMYPPLAMQARIQGVVFLKFPAEATGIFLRSRRKGISSLSSERVAQ